MKGVGTCVIQSDSGKGWKRVIKLLGAVETLRGLPSAMQRVDWDGMAYNVTEVAVWRHGPLGRATVILKEACLLPNLWAHHT